MPGLQYRETIAIDSGGYPGEGVGSNGHTSWTDAAMSGTSSVSYYYHDSDYANDNNSSKVTVVITTTWTATLNNDNSIDVTFSSVIDSLSRGDIRGNPGTIGRTITIYNKPGGSVVWGPQSTAVQTPATYISTDVPIATQTVHIAPQSEANLASLYYLNVMHGYEGRPLPNIGTDAMRMGVFFRNTLPPDYRPGKTWDGNIWQSHNRDSGSYIGKNKFNTQSYYNAISSDKTHATVSLSNNAITWSNDTNDSYFPVIYSYSGFSSHQSSAVAVEPNTPYVFSCKITGTIGSGRIYIYEGDASYNGINVNHEVVTSGVDQPHFYFVTTANTKYIIVRFARWDSTTSTVTLSEMQLAKKTGKNILDPFKLQALPSRTQGGVTLTRTGEGTFTISGSGTQSGIFGSNWVDYTHAETVALLSGPGTYVMSTTATGAFYPALGIELRQNSSTVGQRWLSGPGSGTVEITQAMIDNPTFNLRFSFYGGSGQTIRPATFYVQFEKGSQATSYEAFVPPYEPYTVTNYTAGAVDIFTSTSSKRTMRTQDGASGSNNPPQIYHTPGVKLNMRKIGEHA